MWHETDTGLLSRENSNVNFEGVGGRVIKTLGLINKTTKYGPGSQGILPAYSCCSDALVVQLVVLQHYVTCAVNKKSKTTSLQFLKLLTSDIFQELASNLKKPDLVLLSLVFP